MIYFWYNKATNLTGGWRWFLETFRIRVYSQKEWVLFFSPYALHFTLYGKREEHGKRAPVLF
jgi:hypothetical protein